MNKILEVTWLTLALCGLSISIWRFALEGPSTAIWFLLLTLISGFFYSIRRRNRINEQISAKSSASDAEKKAPAEQIA
ncbi:MAG: hypothetical protein HKN22_05500 [Bacteroidia bacterium]|nr:hypothetical protein [Bacteroidia bacterium]